MAATNEQAFQALRASTASPERHWAGTALFYAAVHYADALLSQLGERPAANHDERWRQLDRHVDDDFLAHYGALKDLSEDWRYYGVERDLTYLDRARNGHYKPIAVKARAVTRT